MRPSQESHYLARFSAVFLLITSSCWCSNKAGALLLVPSRWSCRDAVTLSPRRHACPGSSLRCPGPAVPLRGGKEHGGKVLLLQHVLAAPAGPRRARYEPSLILLWWERYRLDGFARLHSSLPSVSAWWDWWG